MKYTIMTKTYGEIECQSYTLLTNKGLMYSMEETLTQDSKDLGYVSEAELQMVRLNDTTPAPKTVAFEPTIGQA